jgi:hypothetical protein
MYIYFLRVYKHNWYNNTLKYRVRNFNTIITSTTSQHLKKGTETWIGAGKQDSLEMNVEESKYMVLSHHQNGGQNRDIKIGNI